MKPFAIYFNEISSPNSSDREVILLLKPPGHESNGGNCIDVDIFAVYTNPETHPLFSLNRYPYMGCNRHNNP